MKKNEKPKGTSEASKEYYGLYANIAENNAFVILDYLEDKHFASNETKTSLQYYSPFLRKLKEIDQEQIQYSRILLDLKRHFPLVKVLENVHINPKGEEGDIHIADKVQLFFKFLRKLRNHYSHFKNSNVHSIFPGSEAEKIQLYVSKLFNHARQEAVLGLPNEDTHVLFKQEVFALIEKYKDDQGREQTKLSTKAVQFLLCSFLDKAMAMKFLMGLFGYHDTSDRNKRVTHVCMTAFSVNLPEPKFNNENPRMDLVLHMVNYLDECPRTLYKSLSNSDKKQDWAGGENYRVRRKDYFPEFALHFLDDFKCFPDILFELYIGKELVERKDSPPSEDSRITDKGKNRRPERRKTLKRFYSRTDWLASESHIRYSEGDLKNVVFAYKPRYRTNSNKVAINFKLNDGRALDEEIKPQAYISKHELKNIVYSALKSENYQLDGLGSIIELYIHSFNALCQAFVEKDENRIKLAVEQFKEKFPDVFDKKGYFAKSGQTDPLFSAEVDPPFSVESDPRFSEQTDPLF